MPKRLSKLRPHGVLPEYGFQVAFRTVEPLSDEAFEAFIEAFILQAIEAHGLQCGGGGTPPWWSVFVTTAGRGSATEAHRHAVQQWLAAQPESRDICIGPLVNAWAPP
ncbi:MAG: 50S ribosome-binding protein YggL [Candidatus Tectimicrobiota bacterium]